MNHSEKHNFVVSVCCQLKVDEDGIFILKYLIFLMSVCLSDCLSVCLSLSSQSSLSLPYIRLRVRVKSVSAGFVTVSILLSVRLPVSLSASVSQSFCLIVRTCQSVLLSHCQRLSVSTSVPLSASVIA